MTDEEWEMVVASEKWEAIYRERVQAARKRQRAMWRKIFGYVSEWTDDLLLPDGSQSDEPREDQSESACWDSLLDEAAREHMEYPDYIKWREWKREEYKTLDFLDWYCDDDSLYDDDPPEPLP